MTKRAQSLPVPKILLRRNSTVSLCRQLCLAFRGQIIQGQLVAGQRLPSTRVLAGHLGVSRNTVLETYERLAAAGYLNGQVGSGTRVARPLPETYLSELPHLSTPSKTRDFRRIVRESLYPVSTASLEDCDQNGIYISGSW
jgi:GntR family transcriptional regulator/MocR family aminotransferase